MGTLLLFLILLVLFAACFPMCALMRANYDAIEALRARVPDTKRLALKNVLGALLNEGRGLSGSNREAIRAWQDKTYALLDRALGRGEAEHFVRPEAGNRLVGGDKAYRELAVRMERLAALVARVETVTIAPDWSAT